MLGVEALQRLMQLGPQGAAQGAHGVRPVQGDQGDLVLDVHEQHAVPPGGWLCLAEEGAAPGEVKRLEESGEAGAPFRLWKSSRSSVRR